MYFSYLFIASLCTLTQHTCESFLFSLVLMRNFTRWGLIAVAAIRRSELRQSKTVHPNTPKYTVYFIEHKSAAMSALGTRVWMRSANMGGALEVSTVLCSRLKYESDEHGGGGGTLGRCYSTSVVSAPDIKMEM